MFGEVRLHVSTRDTLPMLSLLLRVCMHVCVYMYVPLCLPDDAAEAEDHQEAAAAPDGAVAEDAPGAGGGAGAAAADPEAAAPHQEVAQAEAHAAAGAAALLLELPKMQHLRSLSLVQVLWAHAAGQPPAAYSALTASSKLQQLDLSFSLIPAAAWYRMFDPATVSLPDLTSVYILCSQAPITDTHLECMVQCCPKLSTLWIKGSLQHGAQLTGLAGAKTLTSLSLNHVSSDAALAVLAELQGLEELQMSVVSSICASGMLQLSALKALIRLRVESSPETWIAKYGLVLFVNKVRVVNDGATQVGLSDRVCVFPGRGQCCGGCQAYGVGLGA